MKTNLLICLLAALAVGASPAPTSEPARKILGLTLSMTKEQARERLKEIGTFVREEAGWQEIWKVEDDSYSDVIVGFGDNEKLHYITAVARTDEKAKRKEYGAIGSLKSARQMGDPKIKNFNYQWELAATKDSPRTLVTVAGRDPKFFTTCSWKNLENKSGKHEKD